MILFVLLASVVLGVDALSKLLSTYYLAEYGVVRVLSGVLELRLTRNSGMALGIMSGNSVAIIVLPLAVMVAGYFLLRRYERTSFKTVALALIFGGFLGNFIERVSRGFVLDMIYFPFMPWFVCNLADVAICAGVAMLAASLLFRPKDWREKHAKADPSGDE